MRSNSGSVLIVIAVEVGVRGVVVVVVVGGGGVIIAGVLVLILVIIIGVFCVTSSSHSLVTVR